MPHSKSQAKRLRQDEVRRLRNRSTRSRIRTLVKRTVALADAGKIEEAEAAYREAASAIDKASKIKVVPRNTAARRKSRMAKHIKAARKGS